MDNLADILTQHAQWLTNPKEGRQAALQRADLRNAILRYADLRYANLQKADLRGAILCYTNLRNAILRYADLRGANLSLTDLRAADLRGANLQGAHGIIRLPVGDPRGYDAVAVQHDAEWMIAAGCRWLTLTEALAHWGKDYEGDREIGDRYLSALAWLQQYLAKTASE